MALFLFIIIIAIALGILGVVLHGLFWLLIIGIVIFLLNLLFGGIRYGRNRGSRLGR
ncbi:MAG TPA: hypothetical protein VN847_21820 [Streptosporangiaceae bacterium]|jgi:hypothetical protein|nr:hypothetical protein [Streptosporangiaceae bacterium]